LQFFLTSAADSVFFIYKVLYKILSVLNSKRYQLNPRREAKKRLEAAVGRKSGLFWASCLESSQELPDCHHATKL